MDLDAQVRLDWNSYNLCRNQGSARDAVFFWKYCGSSSCGHSFKWNTSMSSPKSISIEMPRCMLQVYLIFVDWTHIFITQWRRTLLNMFASIISYVKASLRLLCHCRITRITITIHTTVSVYSSYKYKMKCGVMVLRWHVITTNESRRDDGFFPLFNFIVWCIIWCIRLINVHCSLKRMCTVYIHTRRLWKR